MGLPSGSDDVIYGSEGNYQCAEGEVLGYRDDNSYAGSPVTSCGADGNWERQDDVVCIQDFVPQVGVEIDRGESGDENNWAVGYYGELYSVVIETVEPVTMEWVFRGYTVTLQVNGPDTFHQQKSADYSIGYYATFSSVSEGVVTSQMILIDPLTSSDNGNDVIFRTSSLLSPGADTPSFVKTITVKTCSGPGNVNVAGSNVGFGEQTEFTCGDGEVLKYKDNGEEVVDPATQCSADGEFTGSENVECVPIQEKPIDDNTDEDDKNKVIIISCSCVGGALVIFFILYCACCRNKDKIEPDSDIESNSSVSTKKSSKEEIEMKTKQKKKRKESAAYDNSVQF